MLFSELELYNCSVKTALNYLKRYLSLGDELDLKIYQSCFYGAL